MFYSRHLFLIILWKCLELNGHYQWKILITRSIFLLSFFVLFKLKQNKKTQLKTAKNLNLPFIIYFVVWLYLWAWNPDRTWFRLIWISQNSTLIKKKKRKFSAFIPLRPLQSIWLKMTWTQPRFPLDFTSKCQNMNLMLL